MASASGTFNGWPVDVDPGDLAGFVHDDQCALGHARGMADTVEVGHFALGGEKSESSGKVRPICLAQF